MPKKQPILSRRDFLRLTAKSAAMPFMVLLTATTWGKDSALPAFNVAGFKKIYDPSVGEDKPWYINDHTFIRAEDGTWHLFGITHAEPANPGDEKYFAHATAPSLMGPWTKQLPVLPADPKFAETVVWAPYVLRADGKYWMYYCGGGATDETFRIDLATSQDLTAWQREAANPMLIDGFDARDPMVLPFGDQWILYYCATTTTQGGHHTIKAVTSHDLLHWDNPREVFSSPAIGTYGGPTESPFVIVRNGKYYLFVCTNRGYNETTAYESDSPFHWDSTNQVGVFPAHASEIIQSSADKWYVSRSGWGQGGVYLAELTWTS